jgi:4-hydroxy-2-oxoheptanedioate aldolase
MSINRVKELWESGSPAFGALVTMPSPQVVQVLSRSGFDFLLIDLEHGPIDLASAHSMIVATAGTPAVPMARIAANIGWLAKPLLDAGALGICVPMVCSKDEAEAAARAVRYPLGGERMWGPFFAPLRWDLPMQDYMRAADADVVSMITIEHADAIERIDEIVEAAGVDVAIIGPGDLATSFGLYGQIDHPDVQQAMRRAERAILASRMRLGGVAFSAEQANRMADAGYRMIFLGFDWSLLRRGAAAAFDGIRRAV